MDNNILDDYIPDVIEFSMPIEQGISHLFIAGLTFFVVFCMTFIGGLAVLLDPNGQNMDASFIAASIIATILSGIAAFFVGRWAKRKNIQKLTNKTGHFAATDGTIWRMQKIKVAGVDYLTFNDLTEEIHNGAKFVQFTWTISFINATWCPTSKIYFLRRNESAFYYGWKYALLSMLFGWWGIFGPIVTIINIIRSFTGTDVTDTTLYYYNLQPK